MALLLSAGLFAQDERMEALVKGPDLTIDQTMVKMKKQARPAFTLYLFADEKDVDKQWKSFVSIRYSAELRKSKKHDEALNIRMADVAEGTVSLYSRVDKDEKGARLDVFLQIGSSFIDNASHPEEAAKLRNVIDAFARELYVGVYAEALDDERKEHGKVAKDFEKLEKDLQKLDKSIGGSEKDVAEAEKEISEAEQKIKELRLKVQEERLKIEAAKKELAEYQKDRTKVSEVHRAKKAEFDEGNNRIERLKANGDGLKRK